MGRQSRAARVVASIASLVLLAGCASAPSATPESASSASTASATPATTASAAQHVVAGPVGLDVPASWHVRQGSPNPSGNVTFAYLGPVELVSECEATAQGGVCHPWPVVQLDPGQIVVAVRLLGMPGSQPPAGGDPIVVDGLPARRIGGPSDEACRAIGGSELIDVVLPAVPGTTGWIALDACIAGGDTVAAETAFDAILASVAIGR